MYFDNAKSQKYMEIVASMENRMQIRAEIFPKPTLMHLPSRSFNRFQRLSLLIAPINLIGQSSLVEEVCFFPSERVELCPELIEQIE